MSTLLQMNSNQFTTYLDQLKADYQSIFISKINEKYYRINLSNLLDNDLLILIN